MYVITINENRGHDVEREQLCVKDRFWKKEKEERNTKPFYSNFKNKRKCLNLFFY